MCMKYKRRPEDPGHAVAKARGGGYGVRLGRALAGSRFASATPADAKGPAHAS